LLNDNSFRYRFECRSLADRQHEHDGYFQRKIRSVAYRTVNRFKNGRCTITLCFGLICICWVSTESAQILAFPTAQGFGANVTGGRGGSVYHVTNLNESGAGSLADGCSQPHRTLVFDVGGIIKIKTRIMVSDSVTIAGQTAPGDGIVVYGFGIVTNGKNIIVRYLTILGSLADMPEDKCTITWDGASNVIYDHCTIGWGRWDNIHITNTTDVTLQYCIIGEGIDPQRFGAITDGTRNWTVHHNLWIDLKSRNPKMKCFLQYINNIVYNYGCCGIVGGHSGADNYQDVINNYFIAGPNSGSDYLSDWTATDHAYSSGNFADLNKDGALNGIAITTADFANAGATVQTSPHLTSPIPVTIESAAEAYTSVLNKAGSSLHRLATDNRLIGQLKSLGKEGATIADESVVGGVGTVRNGTPLPDADRDGMPDAWETAHGLNPSSAEDRNNTNLSPDNYTNLEIYLNELAADPVRWKTTANSSSRAKVSTQCFSLTPRGLMLDFPAGSPVRAELLDVSGKVLEILYDGSTTGAVTTVPFNRNTALSPGIRLIRVFGKGRESILSMIYLR
jgi:pectate lyase